MTSLYQAIVVAFHNGIGKEYCIDLSLIVSKEVCNTTHVTRDTFSDGFKLFKETMSVKQRQQKERKSSTFSNMSGNMTISSGSGSSHKKKYSKGNCTADLIIFNKVKSPHHWSYLNASVKQLTLKFRVVLFSLFLMDCQYGIRNKLHTTLNLF